MYTKNDEQFSEASHESLTLTGGWKKQLTTVTPFSKYLALALFILLPVGGFWLGMQYGEIEYPENVTSVMVHTPGVVTFEGQVTPGGQDSCPVDGICSIIVDDTEVIWAQGWTGEPAGWVEEGVEVGDVVEVYGYQNESGVVTIYGDDNYFIKHVLTEAPVESGSTLPEAELRTSEGLSLGSLGTYCWESLCVDSIFTNLAGEESVTIRESEPLSLFISTDDGPELTSLNARVITPVDSAAEIPNDPSERFVKDIPLEVNKVNTVSLDLEPGSYVLTVSSVWNPEVSTEEGGGRLYDAEFGFPIEVTDSDAIPTLEGDVKAYATQWKTSSGEKKWEALQWLQTEAIAEGASLEMVQEILGVPTVINGDGGWVYEASEFVGSIIFFEGGLVTKSTFYEV